MEKPETFITNTREINIPIQKRIFSELLEDISVFEEDIQPLIKKFLHQEILEKSEVVQVSKARDKWWQEKYGFPYSMKTAREEVISRKYAPQGVQKEIMEQQTRFFTAIKGKNQEDIEKVKHEYLEKFPTETEGVTVLFELQTFLKNQIELSHGSTKGEERLPIIQELTEYQFLLTDFIRFNQKNKEFLSLFWTVVEDIAKETGSLKSLNSLRRSILSQVATYSIFEKLGKKPSIAHPSEDAFRSIDLWTEGETKAIQIKGSPEQEVSFVETKEMGFPAIELHSGNKKQQKYITTKISDDFQRFKVKLDVYGKELHKDISGYFLVIPYSKFDFVTGEPSDDIVEFMRSKITQNDDKHD